MRDAAGQTWPPFVLVAGLLMIGVVAHEDGLFEALGAAIARLRVRPSVLLVALLGVVAAVTAVLNLDTSVAFLTPVLVLAARARAVEEEAFLYGALLMSNAASLLLPGSNLTNLLVLAPEHIAGALFAARMLPAWVASIVVTAAFTVVVHRRALRGAGDPVAPLPAPFRPSLSAAGICAAAVLVLILRSPALPVFGLGLSVAGWAVARGTISRSKLVEATDPASLLGIFGIAVALGTLARTWDGPAHVLATASRWETAVLGAVSAVLLNNLPAAVLLSSRAPAHPRALLLGLDLGPNLAVTGSLSAIIWYRAARAVGARPSARRASQLGIVLVPASVACAGLALLVFAPTRF